MSMDQNTILNRVDQIHTDLRNDEHNGFYNGLLVLIVVLFLSVIIFHFIKYAFSIKLVICILVLFMMLLLYKTKMQSAYKASMALKNYEEHKEEDHKQFLHGYINFIESGLHIKEARTLSIRNLYIAVFPLFLLLLREVFLEPFQGSSMLWAFIFAFIISYLAWRSIFNKDLEKWDDQIDEVAALRGKTFS